MLLCFCLCCKEYCTAINKQWSVGGSCADHSPDGHRSEPLVQNFVYLHLSYLPTTYTGSILEYNARKNGVSELFS